VDAKSCRGDRVQTRFSHVLENNFFDAKNVHGRVHPVDGDRENDNPTTTYDGKSSLLPKADVCGANRHVCFGPIADLGVYAAATLSW